MIIAREVEIRPTDLVLKRTVPNGSPELLARFGLIWSAGNYELLLARGTNDAVKRSMHRFL